MTTRTIYDLYDLNTPFVSATAPAPQATATTTRGSDKMLRGFTYLAIMAGVFLLAAFVVSAALANVNVDLTVPCVVAFLGGLGAVAWGTVRA